MKREINKEEILARAREAELTERDLVVTLGGIPERLALARQEVDELFNLAYYEWQAGQREERPSLDLSSVHELEEHAEDLKREAHAAG